MRSLVSYFSVALFLAVSVFAAPAFAQTTSKAQLVVTWHASQSYVPPGYVDKALPNQAST